VWEVARRPEGGTVGGDDGGGRADAVAMLGMACLESPVCAEFSVQDRITGTMLDCLFETVGGGAVTGSASVDAMMICNEALNVLMDVFGADEDNDAVVNAREKIFRERGILKAMLAAAESLKGRIAGAATASDGGVGGATNDELEDNLIRFEETVENVGRFMEYMGNRTS